MNSRLFYLLLPACLITGIGLAQPALQFKKITVEQGLNDGAVQAIAHDSSGFMWFSTIGGLNRYDGTRVRFFDQVWSDTGVVPTTICRSMALDSAGRLFFGFENGLARYDAAAQQLRMERAVGRRWVLDVLAVSDTSIYLNTYEGLLRYNPAAQRLTPMASLPWFGARHGRIRAWTFRNGNLVMLTQAGLFRLNVAGGRMDSLLLPAALPLQEVNDVAFDGAGQLWLSMAVRGELAHVSPDMKSFRLYRPEALRGEWGVNRLSSAPGHGYMWLATQNHGLLQYLPAEDRWLQHTHNPLQGWTSNTNMVRAIHVDDRGLVWIGGDYGVNVANPGKSLFAIIPAFGANITDRSRRVARVASEDREGHLWFGTLDGVVQYNPATGGYREFNNRPGQPDAIQANSVRGVLATPDDKVWIATGRGINRYDRKSGRMEWFDERQGIVRGFFFAVNADRNGDAWFSCRDGDGLYYYRTGEGRFYSIAEHPHLKAWKGRGFRHVYHDSAGRYWMGFNGAGLGMYDPASGRLETWSSVAGAHPPVAGNYVVEICEDRQGKIWVSTFNGLSCIDPATFAVTNYTTANGLLSNTVAALAVDSLDRLWMGTARGLMMLDAQRRYFTSFGQADGLPSVSFPEHASARTASGEIIMGTVNGYIRFNPLHFQPGHAALPCYLSDITVLNRREPLPAEGKLRLPHYQNSIQLQLVALNYDNPARTWYAYKLEGFDKSWRYTQDPKVVYTNLPGGSYRLLYKAGTNAYDWQMPAQAWSFRVGTVFYKAPWFWLLAALLTGGLLYRLYRYRLSQQQRLFSLEGKAQQLEKEKALVMYENLKQHLNPHFLFNSLTSLSSLIRLDQQMAGDFLDRMSKIYRYILKNREADSVTLAEEIAFVQHYIDLQKTRFEEGLQVNIRVDEESLTRRIAPVTLQNLVENAIKHNTISKARPLVIDMFADEDYLVVRNNLQRKGFVETSNRQGLESMKTLYAFLSDNPLTVESDENFFWVRIPLV